MEQQAEAWQRPAGWYDVGGGWSAYWNGQAWTGDRMPNTQRWPGPPAPTAPAARAPGRGLPWWAWIAVILVVLFIGLPLAAAFLEGFTTGLNGR